MTHGWLHYIMILARGGTQEHMTELEAVFKKLEANGHREGQEKTRKRQNETTWIGQ